MDVKKFFLSFVFMAFCFVSVSVDLNAQLNHVKIRNANQLELKADNKLDFGEQFTIEFYAKFDNDGSHDRVRKDTQYKGGSAGDDGEVDTDEMMSCRPLISSGTEGKLDFAVVMAREPETGEAMLGFINSFEDMAKESKFIRLTKNAEYDGVVPLIIERARVYHIAISKAFGSDYADVYVDGLSQGDGIHVGSWKSECDSITLGAKFGPHTQDTFVDDVAQIQPFTGLLGGLRIWNRGLSELSIAALENFGPSSDAQELTMLLEYSNLVAYGNFDTGGSPDNWKNCKLVSVKTGIGGVWRNKNAKVIRNYKDSGKFLDYPVYSFVAKSETHCTVYEDATEVGTMTTISSKGASSKKWKFQHVDSGWPPIEFEEVSEVKRGRPLVELRCKFLPKIPRPFGGIKKGSLTLERGTLDHSGAGFSTQQFFGKIKSQENKSQEDLTQVFLLSNNLRYKNVLYRGYNVTGMDGINLFKNGVNSNENYIFQTPEQGLFEIDNDQLRIIPVDLEISNTNMGETSTTSKFISNAMEYNEITNSRRGIGVSGSVTAEASGKILGVGASVSGTVNMNYVPQHEQIDEMLRMETSDSEKVVSTSWYEHYDLFHRKERTRLSPAFKKSLLELYENCNRSNESQKQVLINQFFDNWGTHYVFGGTFGAMKWYERTLTSDKSNDIAKEMTSFFRKINEADTGKKGAKSTNITNTITSVTAVAKNVGGNSASDENSPAAPGDEPAPIRIDLRRIVDVMSPHYFPDRPEIFEQTRAWVEKAYPSYLLDKFKSKIDELESNGTFTKAQLQSFVSKLAKLNKDSEWESSGSFFSVEIGNSRLRTYSEKRGDIDKKIAGLRNNGMDPFALQSLEVQQKPSRFQDYFKVAMIGVRGTEKGSSDDWFDDTMASKKTWSGGQRMAYFPIKDYSHFTYIPVGHYYTNKQGRNVGYGPRVKHKIVFDLQNPQRPMPKMKIGDKSEWLGGLNAQSGGKEKKGLITEVDTILSNPAKSQIKVPTTFNDTKKFVIQQLMTNDNDGKYYKWHHEFYVTRFSRVSGLFKKVSSEVLTSVENKGLGTFVPGRRQPIVDFSVNRSKAPVGNKPNSPRSSKQKDSKPVSAKSIKDIHLSNGIRFSQHDKTSWKEYSVDGTLAQAYRESSRNANFIELHAVNRQMRVHIYPDKITWQERGMPKFEIKGHIK